MADTVALKLGDYTVTESGFAADMGAEKFLNITCRYGGFSPDCVVVTCTVRALKMHGMPWSEISKYTPKQLAEYLKEEHYKYLEKGIENLETHIENMKKFGVPVVNTINRFAFDRDEEVADHPEARREGRRQRLGADRGVDARRRRRRRRRPRPW